MYLDNKYTRWYFSIISSAKEKFRTGCTEKYHIIPRSTGGSDDDENLVRVTAREHYVLHWMLTKMLPTESTGRFKMVKAFNRFHQKKSKDCAERYYNSRGYQWCKEQHSLVMKIHNPMNDQETKEKAALRLKNWWTEERRKLEGERRRGINNISPEGIKRLSDLWMGVPRPKTEEHIQNAIKSSATGIFHTPFGDFYSPGQASLSSQNSDKLSRFQINRKCKNGLEGYSYTSFNKPDNRGKWKR